MAFLYNVTHSFAYGYDGASRITQGSYMGVGSESYALNSVSYDLNGNIKTLSRNGLKSDNTFGLIDNLAYTYQSNSNKIQKVDDNSNDTASFADATGETDYTYSLDGSLISDTNKGISVMEYNYLKLPRRIVKNGVEILYQYDALGKKLKETIGSNFTDYNGNTIYKNGALYQISHDEGRIINGEYEYNIKDHLGNLRVAFRDSLGFAKITQSSSYGIWGENLPTLSYLKASWKKDNFRFTGKENLPETGYTDFGARFYDNIVPRFLSQDIKAEKWNMVSPYVYTLNNPLRFIDPDGKDVTTTIKTTQNSETYASKTIKNTITLTVVNLAGADLSKTMFNQSSGSMRLASFSGSGSFSYPNRSGKKDISYNIETDVKYKVVSSLDKIGKNDHVMLIVNEIKGTKTGDVLGRGAMPGQISAVESGTIGKSGASGFNEVVQHELGHNLGLDHTNGGLMNPSINGSTSLNDEQKGNIVARMGMGVEAKDGTYLQSKQTTRYEKDSKTQAQEFKAANVIR